MALLAKIKLYLSGTRSLGLVYTRGEGRHILSAFVDAAFATEPGAQSRIGWFCLFLGNLVSWGSEVISRVVTSSTEAECRGLSQFAKENKWQRALQNDLGIYHLAEPTLIFEDNTAAITMAVTQGTPHKRSKHFDVEWHYFKEAVEHGEAKLQHVSTQEQAADMLTKALPQKQFIFLRDKIMGAAALQAHFDASAIAIRAVALN